MPPAARPVARLAARHAPALCAALFFCVGLMTALAAAANTAAGDRPEGRDGGLYLRPPGAPGVRVPAPVVAATADIVVNGVIGRATVRQTFINPEEVWVEAVYKFPLPEGAAVDRLRLRINERIIDGVVAERADAQKRYRAAAAAGRRASLLEQERPNLFTMSVANIPPKGRIEVEIAYQQTVDRQDGRYSIRFPTAVTSRYLPDPGSATPAGRRSSASSGAAGNRIAFPVRPVDAPKTNPVAISVRLKPGLPLGTLESPSHKLMVAEPREGEYDITLKAGAVASDRDFVLEWTLTPGPSPAPALFVEKVDGAAYLLAMIVPPRAAPAGAKPQPREIVFVIDTSGSMHGTSLRQARDALQFALGRLDDADRFNVIAFSDKTRTLFSRSRPADAPSIDAARSFIEALAADGGTEIGPALHHALAAPPAAGRIRQIVLLTDGAVGNEPQLLRHIEERAGDSRLFTVAIGHAPNGYFMKEAARIGRGAMLHITDVRAVGRRMTALFEKLERPALTGIEAAFPDARAATVLPSPVPDLYFGEPLVLTARLPAAEGELRLTGRRGEADWRYAANLSEGRSGQGIAKLWARAMVDREMGRLRRGANSGDVRLAVLDIALRHGLLTDYTSLVAVERASARPQAQPMAQRDVLANPPAGWTPPGSTATGAGPMKRAAAAMRGFAPQETAIQQATMAPVPTVSLGVRGATPAAALSIIGILAAFSGGMLWLLRRRISP